METPEGMGEKQKTKEKKVENQDQRGRIREDKLKIWRIISITFTSEQ